MELNITPGSTFANGSGTFDDPFVVSGTYSRISVSGPVHVELSGVTINGTGDTAFMVDKGASVHVDGLSVSGTWSRGIAVRNRSSISFSGSVSVDGFSGDGLAAFYGSDVSFVGECNLTITGNLSGWGIHLFGHSRMIIYAPHVNIIVRNVQVGLQAGLSAMFQHHGSAGSLAITNSSTPSGSSGVQCTDHSSFSIDQPLTLNGFSRGFDLNSISYAEATGSRTLTNLSSQSSASQNSVLYLP